MSAEEYGQQFAEGPVLASCDPRGILRMTLNQPGRKNAMTLEAWEAMFDILRLAEFDPDVRVLVIAGAGGDFCAGADISSASAGHPLSRILRIVKTPILLHEFPKPVVAQVEGVAVGAGWNVALACDLVVASTTARFAQLFVKRGLSVDWGGSWLLPRLVGLQQAKRLTMLGDFVSAEEAEELGLVTWVKSPEELGSFVDDLAARLAAGPPIALSQNKSLIDQGIMSSFADALANEARAQAVNYATADAAMARQAFAAKTEPEFTGEWAVR
ncbi:MAG: 2-(1,2-epoxy,2-dihydrophenyl)acetyl-CoA isomerase [Frankiales bacterium]|nr:2-(1,2-epoxy,2-dihydrophenyl)acetyl-CoA isomerase [Frankiales bacterium]